MSTAPQGWQTPKTNWQAADIVHPSDFNRIEGDIQAIESGSRTLDPSQVPSGNQGTLRQMLDWFANRILAITGGTNWWDAPATTLAAAKSHIDATSGIHGATSSATANRLVIRDSAGRAQFATPSAAADAATKGYVDSHANATSVHGATSSATANRLVIRDSAGRAQFATPSAAADAATKGYVDGLVTVRARAHAGTFNGNGTNNRPITLGWRPRFVVMMTSYEDGNVQHFAIFLRIDGAPYSARIRSQNISNVSIEPGSSTDIGITDTGFTVSSPVTNASGRTYYYVAIG